MSSLIFFLGRGNFKLIFVLLYYLDLKNSTHRSWHKNLAPFTFIHLLIYIYIRLKDAFRIYSNFWQFIWILSNLFEIQINLLNNTKKIDSFFSVYLSVILTIDESRLSIGFTRSYRVFLRRLWLLISLTFASNIFLTLLSLFAIHTQAI